MAITDTYLSDSQWSPVPDSGVPCGENELYIDFVGGPYHVQGLNEQQAEQLQQHFAQACTGNPTGSAEPIAIRLYLAPTGSFRHQDPQPMYRDFQLKPLQHQVNVAGENMFGIIDLSGVTNGHLWTVGHEDYFHSNTFENFFRMVVTYRLMENGGLLLHSAGVVNRDKAYLFPGRSEDGKSTLSRLSIEEGRTVLSDDMNAVTWHQGQPHVEKVPFTGDLERSWVRSPSYPLEALFAICKAKKTWVEALPPTRALTLLTSCAPYINADAYRMNQLLENLAKLIQVVPTRTLNFSLSGDVWDVIETTIEGENVSSKTESGDHPL